MYGLLKPAQCGLFIFYIKQFRKHDGREMVERAYQRHLSHDGEAWANAYVTGQPGKPKHRIETWNYLCPIIKQLKAEDARDGE
jgi:hypothetical protein